MAALGEVWDISHMPSKPGKREESERRARSLYRRLMALPRDPDMSNNRWTAKAGVSTSFFTNLQGGSKPASEPSVGNLRAVLEVVGSSIPEFFMHEAAGRVIRVPTRQALEKALVGALPGLPRSKDRQIEYLVDTVLDALALPDSLHATNQNDDLATEGDHEEGAPPRVATI